MLIKKNKIKNLYALLKEKELFILKKLNKNNIIRINFIDNSRGIKRVKKFKRKIDKINDTSDKYK